MQNLKHRGRGVAFGLILGLSAYAFTASIYTTVTSLLVAGSTTLSPTVSGSYITYGHQGLGETDFVNQYGSGSGGFYWWNVAPGTGNGWPGQIMGLDSSGNLSATQFIGHVRNSTYGQSGGCITGGSSYAACSSVVNWQVPFPDTGYVAVCQIVAPVGTPAIVGTTAKATNYIVVKIENGTANGGAASGGSLDCQAQEN